MRAERHHWQKKQGVPDPIETFIVQTPEQTNYSNFTTTDASNVATSYTASGIKK